MSTFHCCISTPIPLHLCASITRWDKTMFYWHLSVHKLSNCTIVSDLWLFCLLYTKFVLQITNTNCKLFNLLIKTFRAYVKTYTRNDCHGSCKNEHYPNLKHELMPRKSINWFTPCDYWSVSEVFKLKIRVIFYFFRKHSKTFFKNFLLVYVNPIFRESRGQEK